MKTLLFTLVCFVVVSSSIFAAPGDSPTDRETVIWRLAASSYTTTLLAKMTAPSDRIPSSTAIDKDAFAHWMQIDVAWNTTFKKVFPLQVFYRYLEYIEGYAYNTSRLIDSAVPPGTPTVDGTNITCIRDQMDENRRPYLFEWDFVSFTQASLSATNVAGIWTFANVPTGVYVIVYGEMESLPTVFLTVQ